MWVPAQNSPSQWEALQNLDFGRCFKNDGFSCAFVTKFNDFSKMWAPAQNSPSKALPNLDFGRCFKTDGFKCVFVIQFDDFGQNASPCPKRPLPGPPKSRFWEVLQLEESMPPYVKYGYAVIVTFTSQKQEIVFSL